MSAEAIGSLRRKAQNEQTALALAEALRDTERERDDLHAENDRLRAENVALVKEDEIKAAANKALLAEIRHLSAERDQHDRWREELADKLHDRDTRISALRAALIAAMEIVQRERVRTVEKAKNGASPNILNWLDAVIAQADAALGREA